MADDDGGLMPDEGQANTLGHDPNQTGALSYLSAKWIQARMQSVADQANDIIDRIVGDGLLKDGFGFAEAPITDDMLMKMTPEQFSTLLETIPGVEDKALLLMRMKDLKLPNKMLMPPEKATPAPTSPPHLSFGPLDTVHSEGVS